MKNISPNRIQTFLDHFSTLKIAMVGDFFLDRYWEIDPTLDEPSVETGLTANQIVGRRHFPGAAGTVTSNLAALGVGTIYAVGFTGQDGESYELRRGLTERHINQDFLMTVPERFTPTYMKPMRRENGRETEMNRFDMKNHDPLPEAVENQIIDSLTELSRTIDAIMIMDQVSYPNTGVVTERVRNHLAKLGNAGKPSIIYADSRELIGLFRNVLIKCNQYELVRACEPAFSGEPDRPLIEKCAKMMSERTARPLFVTLGPDGQLVMENGILTHVPGVRVEGPIDICGAGDATSSGIVASLAAGASKIEAAMFGNIVASITIRQLGTTGTASPEQIMEQALQLVD